MKILEEYNHTKAGFAPLLLSDKWQVAQINHHPDQEIDAITSIDIHFETDEVFVLLEGHAVLILSKQVKGNLSFETIYMKPNVIYNIPKLTWHNIALDKNAKVLIVEDKYSHLYKYKIEKLSSRQKSTLRQQLLDTIKSEIWN